MFIIRIRIQNDSFEASANLITVRIKDRASRGRDRPRGTLIVC